MRDVAIVKGNATRRGDDRFMHVEGCSERRPRVDSPIPSPDAFCLSPGRRGTRKRTSRSPVEQCRRSGSPELIRISGRASTRKAVMGSTRPGAVVLAYGSARTCLGTLSMAPLPIWRRRPRQGTCHDDQAAGPSLLAAAISLRIGATAGRPAWSLRSSY